MNILLVCHYFAPEPGAPQARLLELGRAWLRRGHTVKAVTCFPNHPTGLVPARWRGRLRGFEDIEGVQVFRSWVYATPNEGVFKKALSHVSFMVTGPVLNLRASGPADVVVVSSPTFFALFGGYILARAKRAAFIVEIRDLWPAAIIELGVLQNRAAIRVLQAMEMWAYRVADEIVVVTESFKENLVARGVPEGKVTVITNGVDLQRFNPGTRDPEVDALLDCRDRILVLYIGAFGVSQRLATILRTAAQLRDRSDIVFGLVGEGAEKAILVARAQELKLSNVRFLPAQPKDRMAAFYRTADICLVPLRNVPLFEMFIPSKMFEIMGCARPIVGSVAGESARILERSGAAIVVRPEDAEGIAEAIRALAADPDRRASMGKRGADFVAAHYTRERLAERYEQVMLAARRSRGGTQ